MKTPTTAKDGFTFYWNCQRDSPSSQSTIPFALFTQTGNRKHSPSISPCFRYLAKLTLKIIKALKIFLLFCVALFVGCDAPSTLHTPKAVKGSLDLSGWDFEKDGVIRLDGDWEFYWHQLYTPQDFKNQQPALSAYMAVRSYWSDIDSFPAKGFATYRLKIKLPPNGIKTALKMLDMGTSYKLWVNDELLSSNGVVSKHLDSMVPQHYSRVVYNATPTTEMVLIVQVANNFHSKAGIWESITLGEANSITKIRENALISNLFMAGALFILFVYHLLLFLLRKKEIHSLFFSLLCLVFMLRGFVTGERVLYLIFPNFDLSIGYKIEYISLLGMPVFGTFVIYYLFTKDFPIKTLKWVAYTSAAITAFILFFPTPVYSSYITWMQLYILALDLYFLVIVKATIKRRKFSTITFIAFLILLLASINDILYARLIVNTAFVVQYSLFLFLMVQGYVLSFRTTHAFNSFEELSINLEKIVIERTRELEKEKEKADILLLNILPEETAREMKETGKSKARLYPNVTVLFTDIINFTRMSETQSPEMLVNRLDYYFKHLDAIISRHGLEKIKTIGDAYMAVSGLPNEDENHAQKVADAALEILIFIGRVDVALKGRHVDVGLPVESDFRVRIGIHSGPVVAGVVGSKKFAYDIWGDTVNIAARMEQNSEPSKINISETTYELIKDNYTCTPRGEIDAKNKGKLKMYFVEGRVG